MNAPTAAAWRSAADRIVATHGSFPTIAPGSPAHPPRSSSSAAGERMLGRESVAERKRASTRQWRHLGGSLTAAHSTTPPLLTRQPAGDGVWERVGWISNPA